MRRNYQQELDGIIARQGEKHPRLLLHSCCGPCSAPVLEYLTQYFDVTLFWYNPNIWPQEEFDRRLEAQRKLIRAMGLEKRVQVVCEPRNSEEWYRATEGLEREPEGGRRCTECFRLRLRNAAAYAAEHGFDCFCSTLTLSRHKDPLRINALGEQFAEAFGIP
jgi:predicted adenine nucleotide alpha hydrolase (AANH) superfamily ATPase